MAPNPLHALILLPLYFKRPDAFDPFALVISAAAVDLDVVYSYIMGYPSSHLALHSFVVALTIYPLAISLFTYALERSMGRRLSKAYRKLRWEERVVYPFRTILACSALGGLSHMLIDVWTHPVSPFIFWPFTYLPSNPLYLGTWSISVDAFVVLISAYALYIWAQRWKQAPKPE
jgi:hypothetical protein